MATCNTHKHTTDARATSSRRKVDEQLGRKKEATSQRNERKISEKLIKVLATRKRHQLPVAVGSEVWQRQQQQQQYKQQQHQRRQQHETTQQQQQQHQPKSGEGEMRLRLQKMRHNRGKVKYDYSAWLLV